MASVYRLQLPTLTVNDGSALSLVFRYFPDEAGLPELKWLDYSRHTITSNLES